jgi:hypothetical protein
MAFTLAAGISISASLGSLVPRLGLGTFWAPEPELSVWHPLNPTTAATAIERKTRTFIDRNLVTGCSKHERFA